MEDTPLRSIMFSKAKETVDKTTGGKYPAPYAIINGKIYYVLYIS